VREPAERRVLKVGYLLVRRGGMAVRVPLLRLAGKWLWEAGFNEGDLVEVLVSEREVLIRNAATRSRNDDPQMKLF
jgi:hypothetical protein